MDWLQAPFYVAFFRLHDMRDMAADMLAATAQQFDKVFERLPGGSHVFSSPYGGGILLKTIDDALLVTRNSLVLLGARVSVGLSQGIVYSVADVLGTNYLGRTINRAARLAYLPDNRGGVAASEEFVHDALQARTSFRNDFFGPAQTNNVKRTILNYRIIEHQSYRSSEVPPIAPLERTSELMHVVLFDIVDYSSMDDTRQVQAVEFLSKAFLKARRRLSLDQLRPDCEVRYVPAGDGGAIVFRNMLADSAYDMAEIMCQKTSTENLPVRIAVDTGQIVLRKRGTPMGPAVLEADRTAEQAIPGRVSYTDRFVEHLDTDTRSRIAQSSRQSLIEIVRIQDMEEQAGELREALKVYKRLPEDERFEDEELIDLTRRHLSDEFGERWQNYVLIAKFQDSVVGLLICYDDLEMNLTFVSCLAVSEPATDALNARDVSRSLLVGMIDVRAQYGRKGRAVRLLAEVENPRLCEGEAKNEALARIRLFSFIASQERINLRCIGVRFLQPIISASPQRELLLIYGACDLANEMSQQDAIEILTWVYLELYGDDIFEDAQKRQEFRAHTLGLLRSATEDLPERVPLFTAREIGR